MLIVLNGHTFLDLVRRTKQVWGLAQNVDLCNKTLGHELFFFFCYKSHSQSNHRGVPLDPGINTLTQEVELIQSIYKNQKLVLGIYKLDGAMRSIV